MQSFGLLPPARFLPILESSGLIHSAGEWIINTACRQLASWQQRFELPDLSIAINLSQQQLKQDRLIQTVSGAIKDNALDIPGFRAGAFEPPALARGFKRNTKSPRSNP